MQMQRQLDCQWLDSDWRHSGIYVHGDGMKRDPSPSMKTMQGAAASAKLLHSLTSITSPLSLRVPSERDKKNMCLLDLCKLLLNNFRRTYEDDAGRHSRSLGKDAAQLGFTLPAHAAHHLGGRHAQERHSTLVCDRMRQHCLATARGPMQQHSPGWLHS